jgi:hypothetical protein
MGKAVVVPFWQISMCVSCSPHTGSSENIKLGQNKNKSYKWLVLGHAIASKKTQGNSL